MWLQRDHFLIQLNGHYEGGTTGETFNASGKTDILIRVENKNVFIADTGADGLGSNTGKLLQNLQAEGITPGEIDTVILSHGHPDHIGGNTVSEGGPAFPNARFVMWKDEWDFWTSDLAELKDEEHVKELLVSFAHKNLPPIQGPLHLVDHDMEVVPGIKVIAAPGHTPGHMAVAISSGSEHLLYISDVALHPIHVEQPDWYVLVDFNPQQVVSTRCWLFNHAVDEKALVLAFHFPFPGLGHVVKKREGWQWQPIETMT